MRLSRFLSIPVAAMVLAAAVPASQTTPAVQPGGDIPAAMNQADSALGTHSDPPRSAAHIPVLKVPANAQYQRLAFDIPMRDGVRLHTVVVIPRNTRKVPVLLDRTPYSAEAATGMGKGPLPESILSTAYAELVRAGYAVAVQDVRGKFGSGGEYVMNRPLSGPLNASGIDHSTDAWDTIEWLVRNLPQTNGKVATIGTSYDGWTALMSLINPHPALKASVPINPMVDVWKGDDWFHNGAFRQAMISYFYSQMAARDSKLKWAPPASDEYTAFLTAGSAGAYGNALNLERLPFWQRLVAHPAYDDYWKEQAVDRLIARHGLKVPTLLVDSLWDQEDVYGAPAVFEAVKASPHAFLVLGPWHHGQVIGSATTYGPLVFGGDTGKWFRSNILIPFLDQHLKGARPANIAKVTAFQTPTNRWRRLETWPLACKVDCPRGLAPWFLQPRENFGFAQPPTQAFDSYVSDPAKPVPYRPRPNLSPWAIGSTWRFWLADDQRFADGRPDVLSYMSEPLDRPLTLSGVPLVHLVASTSGTDSDWVVKLIDVFPEHNPDRPELGGYQFAIAMDIIRGRYRNDLSDPSPIPPDVPQTYQFALPAVDYVIQPGHRLMVQVQSSWFPLYDRNPQTYVPNIFLAAKDDYKAATQRVFTGPGGTWIGLPVVD